MIGIAREIVRRPRRGHFVGRFSTSHLHRIGWLRGIKTGHFLCGSGESNRGGDPGRVKEAVNYAHAPREALEQVVALRLHLDDSNENNGPLRVLPGTHRGGVLTDDEVHRLAEGTTAVECLAAQGGVVIMRPLVIHASSKATSEQPRRVLHIEYAATEKIAEGLALTVA